MKLTVGTTPMRLPLRGNMRPLMQNLGPGDVYFDNKADVTADTGIMMPVGVVYEFPSDLARGGGYVYVVADQDGTDVRYVTVG